MNSKDPIDVLTVGKIAQKCQVGCATVQRWINDGKIKAFTLPSGHYRVSVESFIHFLKEYNMPVPEEFSKVNYKILVVDDDENILDLSRQFIEQVTDFNATVRTASNAVQACLELGTFKPDLVILDITMPDVDGLEVAKGIHESQDLAGTQIMIMSGFISNQNAKKISKLGIEHILNKPFQFKELVSYVKRCINA